MCLFYLEYLCLCLLCRLAEEVQAWEEERWCRPGGRGGGAVVLASATSLLWAAGAPGLTWPNIRIVD